MGVLWIVGTAMQAGLLTLVIASGGGPWALAVVAANFVFCLGMAVFEVTS